MLLKRTQNSLKQIDHIKMNWMLYHIVVLTIFLWKCSHLNTWVILISTDFSPLIEYSPLKMERFHLNGSFSSQQQDTIDIKKLSSNINGAILWTFWNFPQIKYKYFKYLDVGPETWHFMNDYCRSEDQVEIIEYSFELISHISNLFF